MKSGVLQIFKQPLELSYQIKDIIGGDKLKYLKTAILREAEIRLFDCKLTVQNKKIGI